MTLTKNDLDAIQKIVKGTVKEEFKPVKKDIKYIKKSINLLIERYDPIVTDHERRLGRVEGVLKING